MSPLDLVPKSNKKWQHIHHLSHLYGRLVNYNIAKKYGALEYANFDEMVALVIKIRRGALLVKRDLADVFCHILVAKSDW